MGFQQVEAERFGASGLKSKSVQGLGAQGGF